MIEDKDDVEFSEIKQITTDKIQWFHTRANTCMYLFWLFSIALGLSSTSLPLFALLEPEGEKNWVVAILSVVVAFCSFMLQIGNYHMLWQNYRRSEFAMKRLRHRTLLNYRSLKSQDGDEKSLMKLLNQFYAEFEEIEATETSTYFSTLKSAKEISS